LKQIAGFKGAEHKIVGMIRDAEQFVEVPVSPSGHANRQCRSNRPSTARSRSSRSSSKGRFTKKRKQVAGGGGGGARGARGQGRQADQSAGSNLRPCKRHRKTAGENLAPLTADSLLKGWQHTIPRYAIFGAGKVLMRTSWSASNGLRGRSWTLDPGP
jgi:hypothetical protein